MSSTNAPATAPSTPPRKRRLWLKILAGLALLLVLLLALAPTIAGSFVPAIVSSNLKGQFPGTIKIASTSLGWFSSQKISGITITDPEGRLVAQLDATLSKGLLSLSRVAMGATDLGEITLSGKADIVRAKDATTNFERALGVGKAPSKSASQPQPGTGKVPPGLNVRLNLDALDVTFTDESVTPATRVSIDALRILAAAQAGGPIDVKLSGKARQDSSSGSLDGTIKVTGWTSADGSITPSMVSLDADITVSALPTAILDTLGGSALKNALKGGQSLAASLGPTLDMKLKGKGNATDMLTEIGATMANASASGSFRLANKHVTLEKPLGVQVRGGAIRSLVPQIDEALKGQKDVSLGQMPDVGITLESLNLPLDLDHPANLDLRQANVALVLTTTQASGTVKIDPAPEAPARDFVVPAINIRVESANLADKLTIKGGGSATIAGQPAGTLVIDLVATNLLDAKGGPTTGVPSVAGKAEIRGIATALAQPFVRELGLELQRDIGPSLDVSVNVATEPPPQPGAMPPANIDLVAAAEKLNARAAVRVSADRIIARPGGISARLANAGAIAALLMPRDPGLTISPTGTLDMLASNFDVQLREGKPDFSKLVLAARADVKNWAVKLTNPETSATHEVQAESIGVSISANAANPLRLEFASILKHDAKPFYASGVFDVPGLFTPTGEFNTDPATLRPAGKLEAKGLPLALARAFMPAPKPGEGDVLALATDVLGGTANIDLTTLKGAPEGVAGASPDVTGFQLSATIGHGSLATAGWLSPRELALARLEGSMDITPIALDKVLAFAAPQGLPVGKPRLLEKSTATLRLAEAMSLPLQAGFKPDLGAAKPAQVVVAIDRAIIDGLELKDEQGKATRLGAAGVESFELLARAAPGALSGERSTDRAVSATAKGQVIGANRQAVAGLNANLATQMVNGKFVAPIEIQAGLQKVNGAALETILPPEMLERGMLAALAGDEVSLTLRSTITPPSLGSGSLDLANAKVSAELSISAPRITTRTPLKVEVLPDRLLLASPAEVSLSPDPAWINRTFLNPPQRPGATPARPGAQASPSTLTLTKPINLTATIGALSLARAAPGASTPGPLLPGVFALDVRAAAPMIAMAQSDGSELQISSLAVHIVHPPDARDGTINAEATGQIARSGPQGAAGAPLNLTASVSKLCDSSGVVTPSTAILTTNADIPALPTPIIDALANQGGKLVELLGPTVDIRVRAQNVAIAPPPGAPAMANAPVRIEANSPRAAVKVLGDVRDGVFVASEPVVATLTEITPQLGGLVNSAIPALGFVEKKREDRPATITLTGLRAPLMGDLSKLEASVDVDPGEARFATSTAFGEILKLVKARTEGMIGQKLDPLQLSISKGRIVMPPYNLKLGEFTIKTEGAVDLSARGIDVVTWIPFGALSDKIAGTVKLNSGLGSAVGRILPIENLTMIPFRTRGSFDKTSTSFDGELLVKSLGENVLRPDRVIERLPDLIPGLRKKGDDPKKDPKQDPK